MIVNVQWSGYKLLDSEIASADLFDEDHHVLYCAGNLSKEASGVTTMGSDRANLGAPTPMGQMGAPGSGCRANIGQAFWYVTMSFSDHQNSVNAHPKVGQMAFQRV
jgi:hypothetical protein